MAVAAGSSPQGPSSKHSSCSYGKYTSYWWSKASGRGRFVDVHSSSSSSSSSSGGDSSRSTVVSNCQHRHVLGSMLRAARRQPLQSQHCSSSSTCMVVYTLAVTAAAAVQGVSTAVAGRPASLCLDQLMPGAKACLNASSALFAATG
jgi:hypothetical protein